MIVAHVTDSHIIKPEVQYSKIAKSRIENLEKFVSNILELKIKPDAIIHTGDISHNGLIDEYKLAYNILRKLKIPIFYTPGNRDNKKNLSSIFFHSYLTNSDQDLFIYSSTFEKFRLVSFDSCCDKNNQGEFTFEKLNIFSKILMEDKKIPTIIFMHHPPYNVSLSSSKRIEFISESLFPRFRKIIGSCNNLIGIFCGHIHRNFKSKIGNVISYTLPPIALDLSRDNEITYDLNKVQYLLHSYSENTGILTKRILVQ